MGLYHVTLRGNQRRARVRDDDQWFFVEDLGVSVLHHGMMGLRTGAAVIIELRRLQQVLSQNANLKRCVSHITSRFLLNLLFKG